MLNCILQERGALQCTVGCWCDILFSFDVIYCFLSFLILEQNIAPAPLHIVNTVLKYLVMMALYIGTPSSQWLNRQNLWLSFRLTKLFGRWSVGIDIHICVIVKTLCHLTANVKIKILPNSCWSWFEYIFGGCHLPPKRSRSLSNLQNAN